MAEQPIVGRDDELAKAWSDVSAAIGFDADDERHLMYLVYNGPRQDWLWTAGFERNGDVPYSPEGQGQSPIAALIALREAVARAVGSWPSTQPLEGDR